MIRSPKELIAEVRKNKWKRLEEEDEQDFDQEGLTLGQRLALYPLELQEIKMQVIFETRKDDHDVANENDKIVKWRQDLVKDV